MPNTASSILSNDVPGHLNVLLISINVGGYTALSIRYLKQYLTNSIDLPLNIKVLQLDKAEIKQANYDAIFQQYTEAPWDIIGVSVYVFNFSESADLVRYICDNRLAKHIAVGGPYFSWATIEKCISIFHSPDYIVIGEGEIPFNSIVHSISGSENLLLPASASLLVKTYKTGEKITLILQSQVSVDLHKFTPIYSESDEWLDNEHKVVIDTSRGCCNSCSYCTWGGKSLRYYSIGKVLTELKSIFSQKIDGILFADSNVISNKNRAQHLIDYIKTENHLSIPIEIFVELGVKGAANSALLDQLGMLDCLKIVEVGLQSCSEFVCEKIGRRLDFNAFIQQFNILKQSNHNQFAIIVDLILGLPFSTSVDFLNSLLQVIKLRPDCIHIFLLQVLPGSDIYANASAYEILFNSDSYYIKRTRNIDEDNLLWLYSMTAAFSMIFSFPNTFSLLCDQLKIPAIKVVELVADEIVSCTSFNDIVNLTGGYIAVYLNPKYYPFFHAKLIAKILTQVVHKCSVESEDISQIINQEMKLNSID